LGEREVRMRREEVSGWLEELAGQVRAGTLMVDGEGISLPEETGARLKSKSKDGRRRLRLELEWAEERLSKKGEKPGKKQEPRVDNGARSQSAQEPEAYPGNGHEAGGNGRSRNGAHVNGKVEAGKRGGVRDYDSHVLVCKGGDCSKKGGKATKKALKSGLRAEGMNRDVRVDAVECLGLCKQGPNVIVYPEGSWYLGLKERDVPEVVEEHLKNGEPVERLAAGRKPRRKKTKG